MKLRWVVERRTITAEQVRAYSEKYDVPMMQAKKELTKESKPVLQYYDNGTWQNVPIEVIEP